MAESVRVRFAPSPTGYLHVGGARTALFDYLYAKHTGGKFILRVEDTDQERSTKEAMDLQLGDLKWLGLQWDEGVEVGGPHEPYQQSQRLAIYQKHAEKLLAEGKAFYCFCSDETLEAKREKAKAEGRSPHYDGTCHSVSLTDAQKRIEGGESAVVRFKVPKNKEYVVNDLIRGDVTFNSDMVGDFVILRSGGMPVYNFCCVVDDHLMEMTHVLRAEEHLSNTLRQLMIYEGLGWDLPRFGHMSLILGEDKQKLSKRHGATSCGDYRERGFLPEALVNYLALLGWSSPSGEEIRSLDELIKEFDLDRVNSSPAVFDETKLKWMNSVYIKNLPHEDLWKRIEPILKEEGLETYEDQEWQNRSLEVFKSYFETLKDAPEYYRPLSDNVFKVTDSGKETLTWDGAEAVVSTWLSIVENMSSEFMTPDEFESYQNQVKDEAGVKGKFLFMPIRVAVVGFPQGAELKQLAPLLKKESLVKRAKAVLEQIKG